MEKLYYFLVYYSFNTKEGFGFGDVAIETLKPMFAQKDISDYVKGKDNSIKSVTLTGFNELTEEQYNIYINKQ